MPKEIDLGLSNNVAMKLVLIPAGKFMMGSPDNETRHQAAEGPQHEVTISKPFYMGIYHVTRGQFAAFVQDAGYKTSSEKVGWAIAWDGTKFDKVKGASWKNPGFDQTDEHPVVCMTEKDAVAFCEWLSKKTGKTVKLPTEAQWEYVCRAGTATAYPWGDNPDDGKGWCNAADQATKVIFKEYGKYFTKEDYCSWDDGYTFTSPVGKFKKNDFGLYDMCGNALQYCEDSYSLYDGSSKTDPQGPTNKWYYRVLRGGSWYLGPIFCRSAFRFVPGFCGSGIGFRVVSEIKQSELESPYRGVRP
jgi:formylglycine-generating enzyme required for sulfatase activity